MKHDNPNKGQYTGGSNGYAKRVSCDGKIFDCVKDCAEYLGVNYGTMRGWLSSGRIPNHLKDHDLRYV
jgi:hypothetical protein